MKYSFTMEECDLIHTMVISDHDTIETNDFIVTSDDATSEESDSIVLSDDVTSEDSNSFVTCDDATSEESGSFVTCDDATSEESGFIVTSDNDDDTNEESDFIVTSDDDDATNESDFTVTKETKVDDVVSICFLEKDDSFLSPWSWNPNAFNNDNVSTKEKKYLSFHPELYFTYQKIQNENAQGNYKLYSRLCSTKLYPAPVKVVITKALAYLPVSYYYKNRKCNRSKKHGDGIVKGSEFIRV